MPPVRDANDVPPKLDATVEAHVDAAIEAADRVREALGEAEEVKGTFTAIEQQLNEQALGEKAKWTLAKKAKHLLEQTEQLKPAVELACRTANRHRRALAAVPVNPLVSFAKRTVDREVEQAIVDSKSVEGLVKDVRARYTALMDQLIG